MCLQAFSLKRASRSLIRQVPPENLNFFDGCRQVESIDPKTTRWPKACQKDYFWVPPGYPFSDFFRKCEKCIISEEYNVFRGSGASKSHHFGTRKSIIFTAPAQNLVFGIFGTTSVTIECQRVENGALISDHIFTFFHTLRYIVLEVYRVAKKLFLEPPEGPSNRPINGLGAYRVPKILLLGPPRVPILKYFYRFVENVL